MRKLKSTEFGLSFGALAPKLKEQVKAQGYRYPSGRDWWQKRADEITGLFISGIMTTRESKACRSRLMNRLLREVQKQRRQS